MVLRFDFGKERLTSIRTDPRLCCREKLVQILARSSRRTATSILLANYMAVNHGRGLKDYISRGINTITEPNIWAYLTSKDLS